MSGSRSGRLTATVGLTRGTLRLDVCLDLPMGTTVAVLGPNGAGKTTLLRALAGLQPLERGAVALGGDVLEDVATGACRPPEDRPIGVVFQDYLLFPHLSALDNVAFGLRSRGVARAEARRRAGEWLERVGLGDRLTSKPRELSGGQAQRVALARALATDPRLLLLDEPLSALDASTRLEVRRELRRHLASFPGVRLVVTHDPLEAIALADVLVVLEDGRVVQTGAPADVTARPRSRYVAELVGVNLWRAHAEGDRVDLPGGGRLQAPAAGSGGDVFALVHPRAVSLHRREPEGTPRNVWKGSAESLDLEGERVRVRVGGPIPIVAEVTPAAVADLRLADGGEVWVSVKAAEIEVYPA
ncbi:MAG: ABC transporter ATP-binding protein [Acidimicrobiia bacterium]